LIRRWDLKDQASERLEGAVWGDQMCVCVYACVFMCLCKCVRGRSLVGMIKVKGTT